MEEQVSTSLSDLPPALTAQVLSHVPQQQRLTQCALVCGAWASAATLATVHVEGRLTDETVPALEWWLQQQHAGQLRTLKLWGDWGSSREDRARHTSLRLSPGQFKQLQGLWLDEFELQLPGERIEASASGQQLSDVAAGVSNKDNGASGASLPSLQHLRLWGVQLESITSLLPLTEAPQLTGLVLRCNSFADLNVLISGERVYKHTKAAVQRVTVVVPAMLRQLPRLSALDLPDMLLPDAAMQQLAAMQGLRQVGLSHVPDASGCDLQLLPSSITELWYEGRALALEPSLPPHLQQLTGLHHLHLASCPLPPTMLGSVTQLQTLYLASCTPLPSGDPEGAEALLAVLSKLARLRDLEVRSLEWDLAGIAPQCFSALTASSHLTRLIVQHARPHRAAPFPEGGVRHMFPAHRQQRLLRHLEISIRCCSITEIGPWCIDSADIVSIISCCPALQHFDVTCAVQPGADLSVLLQLPDSCTSLVVGGAAFPDAAAATVVQLTQLKHLSWSHSKQLTDTGLEQLTALDLERLMVCRCGLSPEVHKEWYMTQSRAP